ncbi:MAG: glycosyltransferase, partial [Oscillospiraceae bacterium]|nr:glycosyltransferase [Oscillospiraceae bacterium]
MPKISIIVPCYNVDKYLEQCLDSLVGQTLQDIEIIAVDDGSPDTSGAILDQYGAKDSRVKPIHK